MSPSGYRVDCAPCLEIVWEKFSDFPAPPAASAGGTPAEWRAMMGEAWDGKVHSYSLATKRFRRLLPAYQRDEQEREQRREQLRRMHARATVKPAAPISAPECANAPAAATAAWSALRLAGWDS